MQFVQTYLDRIFKYELQRLPTTSSSHVGKRTQHVIEVDHNRQLQAHLNAFIKSVLAPSIPRDLAFAVRNDDMHFRSVKHATLRFKLPSGYCYFVTLKDGRVTVCDSVSHLSATPVAVDRMQIVDGRFLDERNCIENSLMRDIRRFLFPSPCAWKTQYPWLRTYLQAVLSAQVTALPARLLTSLSPDLADKMVEYERKLALFRPAMARGDKVLIHLREQMAHCQLACGMNAGESPVGDLIQYQLYRWSALPRPSHEGLLDLSSSVKARSPLAGHPLLTSCADLFRVDKNRDLQWRTKRSRPRKRPVLDEAEEAARDESSEVPPHSSESHFPTSSYGADAIAKQLEAFLTWQNRLRENESCVWSSEQGPTLVERILSLEAPSSVCSLSSPTTASSSVVNLFSRAFKRRVQRVHALAQSACLTAENLDIYPDWVDRRPDSYRRRLSPFAFHSKEKAKSTAKYVYSPSHPLNLHSHGSVRAHEDPTQESVLKMARPGDCRASTDLDMCQLYGTHPLPKRVRVNREDFFSVLPHTSSGLQKGGEEVYETSRSPSYMDTSEPDAANFPEPSDQQGEENGKARDYFLLDCLQEPSVHYLTSQGMPCERLCARVQRTVSQTLSSHSFLSPLIEGKLSSSAIVAMAVLWEEMVREQMIRRYRTGCCVAFSEQALQAELRAQLSSCPDPSAVDPAYLRELLEELFHRDLSGHSETISLAVRELSSKSSQSTQAQPLARSMDISSSEECPGVPRYLAKMNKRARLANLREENKLAGPKRSAWDRVVGIRRDMAELPEHIRDMMRSTASLSHMSGRASAAEGKEGKKRRAPEREEKECFEEKKPKLEPYL